MYRKTSEVFSIKKYMPRNLNSVFLSFSLSLLIDWYDIKYNRWYICARSSPSKLGVVLVFILLKEQKTSPIPI